MTQPDHTDRCPNCFEPNLGQPCPHCGWEGGLSNEAPFLPLGTLLNGCYRVGRVLGHGGFGITYLAWDENLELRLAIKEYLPLYLATHTGDRATVSVRPGEAREQFDHGLAGFLDEARALARFDQHPGIVGVKGFFRANGTGYMVMEYVDGITLKAYLERHGGRVPFQTALALLMPVMDALRAVHKVDLLHRDIAPDNIYIATGGQVKLLDFGAARAAVRDQSQSLSMIFKPGYAPWEQCHKGGRQGPWTDVYALAATLYRAITGSPPPESPDRMEQDEFKAPRDLGLDLPTAAEQALVAALAVKAPDRTQDIQTLQQGLQGTSAPAPRPPDPAPDPIAKPEVQTAPEPAGVRLAAKGALAVIALAVLIGLLFWMGDESTRGERDRMAYGAAHSADTEPAYRAYLRDCGADGCGHSAEAQGRIDVLAAMAKAQRRAAEEQAREAAQRQAQQEQTDRLAREAAAHTEAQPPAAPAAHASYEPELVRIPTGSFLMGSPDKEPERDNDEGPQHQVNVAAFELGKTEVTFAQWDACVADGGCTHKPKDQGWGRGQRPVISVSWDDAQAYVAWLNEKTANKGYRLPSEAEWEYAARAGTTTPFSTGNCIKTDQALYNGNWDYNGCGAKTGAWMKKTQPVGSYAANPWGLRDMHGNVWEWVEECGNDGDLAARTSHSSRRNEQCEKRLVRGGSWYDGPRYLRSASRFRYPSSSRLKFLGFRLARTLIP